MSQIFQVRDTIKRAATHWVSKTDTDEGLVIHTDTLVNLMAAYDRLTKERNDHGPEGRNYTNGQYVELLLKYEAMREALDLALPIVEHNSPTRAEMIRSVLAKIGEGERHDKPIESP